MLSQISILHIRLQGLLKHKSGHFTPLLNPPPTTPKCFYVIPHKIKQAPDSDLKASPGPPGSGGAPPTPPSLPLLARSHPPPSAPGSFLLGVLAFLSLFLDGLSPVLPCQLLPVLLTDSVSPSLSQHSRLLWLRRNIHWHPEVSKTPSGCRLQGSRVHIRPVHSGDSALRI